MNDHYILKDGSNLMQHIKPIIEEFDGVKAFHIGNILKYISRHEKKNGKEDLLKARNYIDFLIENYDK